MIVYEYECTRHGVFDHSQKITDPKLTECPLCHKCTPKRLISGTPAFNLISGPAGGWSGSGYGHRPNELAAMRKLGRKLVKRNE